MVEGTFLIAIAGLLVAGLGLLTLLIIWRDRLGVALARRLAVRRPDLVHRVLEQNAPPAPEAPAPLAESALVANPRSESPTALVRQPLPPVQPIS